MRHRLSLLEKNFDYYACMNWSYEAEEIRFSKSDFREVVKVDTHIHAAAAFTRSELLDFMKVWPPTILTICQQRSAAGAERVLLCM